MPTIEIDFDDYKDELVEDGWHEGDNCPAVDMEEDAEENLTNRRALLDWHDKAHGLTSWQNCSYEPCNQLSLTYREVPWD